MVLEAVVLPPTAEALIGQIALEGMDLHVDCVNRRLIPSPNSPILPLLNLKRANVVPNAPLDRVIRNPRAKRHGIAEI